MDKVIHDANAEIQALQKRISGSSRRCNVAANPS
jgi:hypothetical protein